MEKSLAPPPGDATDYAFGPVFGNGGVTFRLWAPFCRRIDLCLAHVELPMQARAGGWFDLFVAGAASGIRYAFRLDGGQVVADPASRWQPEGVHGPSVAYASGHRWTDAEWTGIDWHEVVYYEAHIGTLTPEGTYRAAIGRLDAIAGLGVNALEIMPLHDFSGRFGWGYDGVLLYAPANCYGSPDDLRALVDAAHARGMMVSLDVVYNHLGLDGNDLPTYAPYISEEHDGEFGDPPNLDGPSSGPVRRFILENVLYWLEEFHFDGLRFDAVQALKDDSDRHLVVEIAEAVKARLPDRRIHLLVENANNDVTLLRRDEGGKPHLYTAQWDDDIHHPMHVAATGETWGYYVDYADALPKLARALTEGFGYQGEPTPRSNESKGAPSAFLPPTAFVSYVQNHDQVGNRPLGERLHETVPLERVLALATICLLSPTIPMIFMGEEWAASTPFPYFADMPPELRETVRASRRRQMADFPDPTIWSRMPDPCEQLTWRSAVLDWTERRQDGHAQALAVYKRLIEVRRRELVPRLAGIGGHAGKILRADGGILDVCWRLADASRWRITANLGSQPAAGVPTEAGEHIWTTGKVCEDMSMPWSVVVSRGSVARLD
ncbi:hypothetical protein VE25_14840 [Devosia geojensis]|uniref:Malto-oligosyltrehalose trehalohydrolase n=1 Tax=Devosia geojensis TaxID=443610 RepID=A0A0F5FR75_9HYPH|nr:malto-oligosyltrehalose trehalohydrolase [Devosia geojensis]KKB11055.1 hypothetical protein VE25_14840 [Devosia geojensis]